MLYLQVVLLKSCGTSDCALAGCDTLQASYCAIYDDLATCSLLCSLKCRYCSPTLCGSGFTNSSYYCVEDVQRSSGSCGGADCGDAMCVDGKCLISSVKSSCDDKCAFGCQNGVAGGDYKKSAFYCSYKRNTEVLIVIIIDVLLAVAIVVVVLVLTLRKKCYKKKPYQEGVGSRPGSYFAPKESTLSSKHYNGALPSPYNQALQNNMFKYRAITQNDAETGNAMFQHTAPKIAPRLPSPAIAAYKDTSYFITDGADPFAVQNNYQPQYANNLPYKPVKSPTPPPVVIPPPVYRVISPPAPQEMVYPSKDLFGNAVDENGEQLITDDYYAPTVKKHHGEARRRPKRLVIRQEGEVAAGRIGFGAKEVDANTIRNTIKYMQQFERDKTEAY